MLPWRTTVSSSRRSRSLSREATRSTRSMATIHERKLSYYNKRELFFLEWPCTMMRLELFRYFLKETDHEIAVIQTFLIPAAFDRGPCRCKRERRPGRRRDVSLTTHSHHLAVQCGLA